MTSTEMMIGLLITLPLLPLEMLQILVMSPSLEMLYLLAHLLHEVYLVEALLVVQVM